MIRLLFLGTVSLVPIVALGEPTLALQLAADEVQPPSLVLLEPTEGQVYARGQPVVVTYVLDPGSKGEFIEIAVNGLSTTTAAATKGKGRHDVGTLPVGVHRLSVRVLNRAYAEVDAGAAVEIRVRR